MDRQLFPLIEQGAVISPYSSAPTPYPDITPPEPTNLNPATFLKAWSVRIRPISLSLTGDVHNFIRKRLGVMPPDDQCIHFGHILSEYTAAQDNQHFGAFRV
jgi:hypothetical protein